MLTAYRRVTPVIKINVIKVQKQYEADHSIAQLKDSEHRNDIQSYFSAIQ